MRRRFLAVFVLVVVTAGAAASGASGAVVGIERVGAVSASNSQNKAVTVSCPAGKKVLSAGADVNPGNGDVLIDDVRPNADLQSVTVNALEDETGTAANWTVSALAICAYPPPGLERVAATSPLNSTAKSVTATCPSGKRVLGLGADLNTFVGQVLVDDLRPNPGLTDVTVNAFEDETGNSTNWSVTSYAVCASPVQGLTRVSSASALDSTSNKVANLTCPAGQQLTGAGGDINTFNGQIVLDAVFPSLDATGGGFAAFEDDTGNPANWSLTSYGICANSVQRVVGTSPSNASVRKDLDVVCPTGLRLTGAGADLTGGYGLVYLERMLLQDANKPDDLFLNAYDGPIDGQRNPWFLRGYAICATPPPGLENLEAFSNQQTYASLPVSCPAGKRLLGTAGGLAIGEDGLITDGFVPRSDLTGMTLTAAGNGPFGDVLWATPLCATAPPGLQLVSATSAPPADDEIEFSTVSVSCPAAKHLIGTGARINNGANQVVLDDLRPDASLKQVTVSGYEDEDGYAGAWTLTAFGICVNY